jgi:hypothetical protein
MSVYGSYPPPLGYDYTAPTSAVVPSLPNETNHFQLPDTYQQGPETAINRYHQQDVYYNDQVIVEDYITWQPIHHRVYRYVPPTITPGPVRSWTEGTEPPTPVVQFNPSATQGLTYPPQPSGSTDMLSTLWAGVNSLATAVQQWSMG